MRISADPCANSHFEKAASTGERRRRLPPSRPYGVGVSSVRVAGISDLHGFLPDPGHFAGCDLAVIAGDVCPIADHAQPTQRTWLERTRAPWLRLPPVRHVVAIAGNHDRVFESDPELCVRSPADTRDPLPPDPPQLKKRSHEFTGELAGVGALAAHQRLARLM